MQRKFVISSAKATARWCDLLILNTRVSNEIQEFSIVTLCSSLLYSCQKGNVSLKIIKISYGNYMIKISYTTTICYVPLQSATICYVTKLNFFLSSEIHAYQDHWFCHHDDIKFLPKFQERHLPIDLGRSLEQLLLNKIVFTSIHIFHFHLFLFLNPILNVKSDMLWEKRGTQMRMFEKFFGVRT